MKTAATFLGILFTLSGTIALGQDNRGGECDGPNVNLVSYSHVSCNGQSDGSITVTASGGIGTNTFYIDNGINQPITNTTGIFTGIPAGEYSIMVTDGIGCSDETTLTLTEPAPIFVNASVLANITCNGSNNGQIQVGASGGIGSQSFSIDGVNFYSNSIFSGLSAGEYTVYMKDAAGCTASTTLEITEPDALVISETASNVMCNGGFDGSIILNGDGGTQPYNYSINSGLQYSLNNTFTSLNAGEYTVVIKDANNCLAFGSVQLSQPAPITASIGVTMATCGFATGSLNIAGAGGNGAPFEYSIDNGDNWQSSQSFTDLIAGVYTLQVKDSEGCVRSFGTAVNTTTGPTIDYLTSTSITCHGGSDGSITVLAVSGGTGTLNYSVGGQSFTTNPNFTGLTAGEYIVAVQDAVGCVDIEMVTLSEPNALVASAEVEAARCYGSSDGQLTINAAGGSGTLLYSLNGINYQTNNTFNVPAGAYYIWVKDAGGCLGLTTAYVQQPEPIQIVNGYLNVNCYGDATGEIYVNVLGGTGPYLVALDDWNYQSQFSYTNLPAGNHTVFVKDANLCLASQMVTISQPPLLSYTGSVADVSCAGGNNGYINITVSGGVAPYSFNWSNGSTTEDILHLSAGEYSVYVTDGNGCTINGQVFTVSAPENPIVINGAVTNASSIDATNGAIDITVSGGTAPYNYVWNNGAITEDLDNLLPGVYGVQVTDASGCSASAGFTVAWNLSIAEDAESTLTMYPNPANSWIKINGGDFLLNQIVIYNLAGMVVYESNPNAFEEEISVDSFANGMYLIQLKSGETLITKKLEVVR
jgi:hypothetical protein